MLSLIVTEDKTQTKQGNQIRYNYTMGCRPVRGDNPQASASGLSYVQVDKHGITILYHISVDLTHHKTFMLKLVRVV